MASPKGKILIVDDDRELRTMLADFLRGEGYDARAYAAAADALAALSGELDSGDVDAILSDNNMPQMMGVEFASRLRDLYPEVPVILMTAYASIESALEAMRRGAFHYMVKPFKLAEMSLQVRRAAEHRRLQRKNGTLRNELRKSFSSGGVIGKSPAMKAIFDLIPRVSQATANVLITGESGSGKEVIARLIHQSGTRADKPFVAINCTAIPEALLESELFGHAKGSFTGAVQRKRGLFEEAQGGTLFLDEIGDMEPQLQGKLLRVIQDRSIRAVGDTTDRPVDVRIVTATHKDLKSAIRDGRFREDLYYRLSVIPIVVPPLRDRAEDIPLLAEHFLRKYAAIGAAGEKKFSPGALAKLSAQRWEGNVRELENVIERAVVLTSGSLISESDIPSPDTLDAETFFRGAIDSFPTLTQLEERYIKVVLEKTGGRKDKASQILGINRRTLYRKEREYGLVSADAPVEDPGLDV